MIPYIEQPVLHLGPITLAAFGVIVAGSVMAGPHLGSRRFRTLALDPAFGDGMAWWVVIGSFLGAHLFAVVLYFPAKIATNPLVVFKVWEDISSFGGILGGALATWVYVRRRGHSLDSTQRWAYADVAAYVFPISLMIGRAACALAHDHPGSITAFPLAVSLAEREAQAFITSIYTSAGRGTEVPAPERLSALGFHDLGWYEFLYLGLVLVPLILTVARSERRHRLHRPGTYVVLFIAAYMPVRFLLDFLRVSDMRYAGLTPAQWTALAALAALPVILGQVRLVARLPLGTDAKGSP